jgi:hypothetical protein
MIINRGVNTGNELQQQIKEGNLLHTAIFKMEKK